MTQGFWSLLIPSQMTSQHLFCSRGVASHGKTNARWNKNRKNYKVTFCQRQASSRNAWCECASKLHRHGGLLKSRQAQVTHLSAFRWASAKFGPVLPQRGFISHETQERRELVVKGPWKTSKTYPNLSKTKVSYIRVFGIAPESPKSLYLQPKSRNFSHAMFTRVREQGTTKSSARFGRIASKEIKNSASAPSSQIIVFHSFHSSNCTLPCPCLSFFQYF